MESFVSEECSNCRQANLDLWIIPICQHRICRSCLSDKDKTKHCDSCRSETIVQCVNSINGCNAAFRRQRSVLLTNHVKTCEYKKIPCSNNSPRKDFCQKLLNHVSNDCTKTIAECSHCRNTFFADEIEGHVTRCDFRLVKCEFCEVHVLRKNMEIHLRGCSLAKWSYEMSTTGCQFNGTSTELQKHDVLNMQHDELMKDYVRRSQDDMKMLKDEIRILREEVQSLKMSQYSSERRWQEYDSILKNLQAENESLRQEVTSTKNSFLAFKDEIGTVNKVATDMKTYEQSFREQNEAFEAKVAAAMKDMDHLMNTKTDLEQRFEAYDKEKETQREALLDLNEKLRKDLLNGLEVENVFSTSVDTFKSDTLLSCLKLIKTWAVSINHLQSIILSRDDIHLVHVPKRLLTQLGIYHDSTKLRAIFNLGVKQVSMFSWTYVLGRPMCQVTWKAITSPYDTVELVVRLKFVVRDNESADVFAEVFHSKVQAALVVIQNFSTKNVILKAILTDLTTRASEVPIFCGRIPCALITTPELAGVAFETLKTERPGVYPFGRTIATSGSSNC